MKLNSIDPFVRGDKFSNGLEIDCLPERKVTERLKFLVEKTRGKRVLHIGFTDHLPLIKSKIDAGRWLHSQLVASCSVCVGIDINRAAIEFVKNELGIPEVYCIDIVSDELPTEITKARFDYIILGEVLEHTNNPVEFLSNINKKFAGVADNIIITVPNAFDYANIRLLRRNVENINTDHRYWFTPFTIRKVVHEAGLRTVEQGFCNAPFHKIGLVSRLLQRYPIMSETLYTIASLNDFDT